STHQLRLDAILEQYRDKEARPQAEREHLERLWRDYLYPLRWRLLLAILISLFTSMQPYIWAYINRRVIDDVLMLGAVIPPSAMDAHLRLVILVFFINSGFHLLIILLSWVYSFQITYIGQRVVFELRKVLHEKVQRLPLSFFDRTQTGRLLTVVLDDVGTIQASISTVAVNFVQQAASILVGAAVILVINAKLGVLMLVALPCYVFIFRRIRPHIKEGNIAARRATTALYNRVEERVTAVRTIKVFGRELAEVRAFTESAHNLARLMMYLVRQQNWLTILANGVSATAIGLLLYWSVQDFRAALLTPGQVIQLYASAGFMFGPAVQLSDILADVQRVSVVLRRIFDIVEADPEPVDRPDAAAIADARGDVAFHGVTFAYPGDEAPTLTDVSFAVPAGKQVAVMGPSGAGKSTLLYLLMRFYDPDAGAVTLDDRDLRDIQLLHLRDRITLVMQEPVIFSGTVAENIRYGHLDAPDAQVREAARNADLHEFILTLPDGYETVVGERGMSLSGGQRQRLALAASLLSRPSVLLLDDTTSALDPETEARVRKTLNRIMAGKTCFVVTHRVSTALASDLVLVL
ncbi:MAG TPA: ABC transporter ATP-binding protein, partial [Armatimonadota bacterium]|nr:ABC transporter ATP-binding protein [Armatimonadota bacterium]